MKIVWVRDYYDLTIDDSDHFYVTCIVRNEISQMNPRRFGEAKEVVRTVNADRSPGKPYMPRKFPRGNWQIIAVERNGKNGVKFDEKEYGPVRIRTDAHQTVDVWILDPKTGGYSHKSPETADDWGYLLHYAPNSRTTLGCGRVGDRDTSQIERLADIVEEELKKSGPIPFKVV